MKDRRQWDSQWRKALDQGAGWLSRSGRRLQRRYREAGYQGLAADARDAASVANERIYAVMSSRSLDVASRFQRPEPATESAAKLLAVLRGIDWNRVEEASRMQTDRVAADVRALLDGVDWNRMAPIAKKAALALAVAVVVGELVDVAPEASRAISSALSGDGQAASSVAGIVATADGTDISNVLARRFVDSQVLEQVSQMAFNSSIDVLRSIGGTS